MFKFTFAVVLPVIALAVAGCQEAPSTPNVAAKPQSTDASSVCGAVGDCPTGDVTPYPMQGNWGGF